MHISEKSLVETYHLCDLMPVGSTFTNALIIFQKCIAKQLSAEVRRSRYWTYIENKSLFHCIPLLIPFLGNAFIYRIYYSKYEQAKAECVKSIQIKQNIKLIHASTLAGFAEKKTGIKVSAEQMMPAQTKEQQRFIAACVLNDFIEASQLLNQGLDPNFYHCGDTPLVTACKKGATEIVKLLINHGADINTPNHFGHSPFETACEQGNLELVQILQKDVLDIDKPNYGGETPLMFAASAGHEDIVAFLLKKGADPHKLTKQGHDAFTCANTLKEHLKIVQMIFEGRNNIDKHQYRVEIPGSHPFFPLIIHNLTPLLYAILNGHVNSAMYLLEKSNVKRRDSTKSTALHYSVKHIEFLKALLSRCNDLNFVNYQDISGSTALHKAIQLKQPEAALLLLQKGADPFILNNKQKIPLILAYKNDFTDIIDWIREKYEISSELELQIVLAKEMAEKNKNKEPLPKKQDAFSNLCDDLINKLELTKSRDENRAKNKQEQQDLGPIPRTAMEILFGTIKWPE